MRIYTVGYGGRKLLDFVQLLKEHDVDIVCDIRRVPKSSTSEYNKESLKVSLPGYGIEYVFMGETLGGFRRKGYAKHTETDIYKQGIRELLRLAEKGNLALMCKERTDSGCHRRYIVETLKEMNVSVNSIL